VFVPERFLQRVQVPVVAETFDGKHLPAVRLYDEHRARFHGLAIEHDSARAAGGGFAANMRSGKAHDFPQVVNQEKARLDFVRVWFSIYRERDFTLHQT
jgi:hypothetical protein